MSQYFPKPHEPFGGDINVKIDLSKYTTKTYIKNISHVHNSSFVSKSNLASLKTKVDKLYIDKLVPVPIDLSKISDVVKNVVKKAVFDQLVAKVNTSGFVKKADNNAKITEIKGKRSYISGLATNAALTTVENISSLVKKSRL